MSNTKKPRLKKSFSIGLTVLGFIYIFLYLIPFHSIEDKAFFEDDDQPLVIAHQGGEHLAPSSTMTAFENAVELGVDVLESDLHMSKDGYLINIHDATVDRTTDSTGRVSEMNLDELKQLDAGYYFQDEDGNHPYRGQGLELLTVEELFQAFPEERFIFEIKDTNPDNRINDIIQRLSSLINDYNMEDQVLVASFDHEIVEAFRENGNENVAISGGRQEVRNFVIFHKTFLRNLYFPKVEAIQIPTADSGFDLTTNQLISGADRIGLDVHYWTINEKEEMRELIELGADGIVTDRPDLMIELLNEMR
ncbi:glycerophosphodiester phosphodiesterase [Halalkalibacillus halophilus]|uniref:glycerophosphodiester phosphodiesterase n=1 Tax=Halalkalibacillus halophilus TaxID=392827 RepID=UPI0004045DF4|nr:glycerophosphodiester phosphodiesterase [Halalkalibacillus halophilus]